MITMCFIKGEMCEIIKGRKMEFLENKRKKCLDEMDGCFLCEMPLVLVPSWLSKIGRYIYLVIIKD